MRLEIKWKDGWAHVHGTGPDGNRIRRTLKTRDPLRAEEARAALEARLWKEVIYGPGAVVTFEAAALRYVEDGGEKRFILPLAAHFRGKLLTKITPLDVRDAARKLYPDAKPATLNRQAIVPARAVINFGHKQGWCPQIAVDGFPVEQPKKVAVDREYLSALADHLPPRLFALMALLQATGRRVGDAIKADASHFDLTACTWHIPKAKNGKPALAHYPKAVAEILKGIMPGGGSAFGYAGRSSLYATLRRACKKAGVEYLGTHQPGRHTYATTLDGSGFSANAIAGAMGLDTVALAQRTYIHANESGKKAVKAIGKKLAIAPRQARKTPVK